jgi:cobalt-precorrin 5A hydrolase/precorrin-3B C17-methyltransferase
MENSDHFNFTIFYLSSEGKELAERLKALLERAEICRLRKELVSEKWQKGNILIFIMAAGIVIRQIAEFIKSKKEDPGVLVINETGKYVIPLLGGHSAYANEIAQKLADFLGAEAVITTASDSKALPALDLWIKRTGLIPKNPEILPKIMAIFNEKGHLKIYKEQNLKIPLFNFAKEVDDFKEAEVIITNKVLGDTKTQLILVVPNLWVGLGFHEGISEEEIEKAINRVFKEENLEPLALKGVATLEKKANYLPLKTFCQNKRLTLIGFNKEELQKVEACTPSERVFQAVGVYSVSEQAALVASKGKLLIPKKAFKDITVAVAEEPYEIPGKLYIVGTGPGKIEHLTLKALTVLREAEVVVGYKTYLKLLEKLLSGKEIYRY